MKPNNTPGPTVVDVSNEVGADLPNSPTRNKDRVFSVAASNLITYSWRNIDVWVGRKGVRKMMQTPKVVPSHDNLDGRTVIDAKWESGSEAQLGQRSTIEESEPEGQVKKKSRCPCKRKPREPSKHLVNNVCGLVRPGELVALMGASGAGKTTLLNVLTYRSRAPLAWTGETYINGMKVGPKEVTAVSAYIQQEDLFFGSLTVHEHLVFYSHLRMDKKYTKAERMDRVIQVMDEFGLTKCKDTKIGIHGRVKGISGGEMKRLAFASEILNDPPLLLCDEPTSGLDSYMAGTVVHVMQMLAARGKTIICTIHQPSSEVFSMFDRILLLSEGRVAFMGTVHDAVKFLDVHGQTCPPNFNPADFLAYALAIVPGRVVECRAFVKEVCDDFLNTPEHMAIMETLNAPETIDEEYKKKMKEYRHMSPYKANWPSMFLTVLWRSWISVAHDPEIILVRLVQSIALGLVIGAVYWDNEVDPNLMENAKIADIAGVLYLLIANISFLNMFAVLDGFLNEVPIFLREHFNGMYRVDVYFLSRMITDLPFFLLYPIVFHCVTYAMIQFQWSWIPFLKQGLVLIAVAQTASSFAYFLSCVCKDLTTAITIGPGLLIPLMLFSGFFIKTKNMRAWNSWITYISWFYYAVEAMVTNQLSTVTKIDCQFTKNPALLKKNTGYQPFFDCKPNYNGQSLLASFDFKEDDYYVPNLLALLGLSLAMRIAAFVILLMKTRGRH